MSSQYGCINCGSNNKVERDHDTFTCGKCHHVWTVADEQAMAGYLRMQGREPAKSILELAIEDGAEALIETQGEDVPAVTNNESISVPTTEQQASGEAAKLPDVPTVPEKPSGKPNKANNS